MKVAVTGVSHWHLPLFAEPLLASGAGTNDFLPAMEIIDQSYHLAGFAR